MCAVYILINVRYGIDINLCIDRLIFLYTTYALSTSSTKLHKPNAYLQEKRNYILLQYSISSCSCIKLCSIYHGVICCLHVWYIYYAYFFPTEEIHIYYPRIRQAIVITANTTATQINSTIVLHEDDNGNALAVRALKAHTHTLALCYSSCLTGRKILYRLKTVKLNFETMFHCSKTFNFSSWPVIAKNILRFAPYFYYAQSQVC